MKLPVVIGAYMAMSAGATSFSVCSGKTDSLGVSGVSFSEDPLEPGTTLTITVDATPSTDVTDGASLDFVVKYGAFPIFSVTKDFCGDLGLTCPLAAGTPVVAKVDVDVSKSAPAASVTAEVSAKNGDGSSLTCIDIPITIGASSKQNEIPLLTSDLELSEAHSKTFFEYFKNKFNKIYESEEEELARFGHFSASLKRAQERNRGLDTPNFGVTKFSDLSVEEFRGSWLNYKTTQAHDDPARLNADVTSTSRSLRGAGATPSSFDWRDSGAVTAVKNQGECGSCWAFSAGQTVESAYKLAGSDLTELSIAQIVQCDTGGEDEGCNGGDSITGYEYITRAGGLASESDYPYKGKITIGISGTCDTSSEKKVLPGTKIKSWSYATPACTKRKCSKQDEAKLAETLVAKGPASICVDAEPWQDYVDGVLKADDCKSGYYDLDHCVQLIGYNGIDGEDGYWIVKNSWDSDWGVDGMIHLEFGSNTCGVADEATNVVLE